MTTAPLFAAAIVLDPEEAVIAALAGGVGRYGFAHRACGYPGIGLYSIYRRRRFQLGWPRLSLTGWRTRA